MGIRQLVRDFTQPCTVPDSDEIRIIDSYIEYKQSPKKMDYIVIELERKDRTGRPIHLFKAIKLLKINKIPDATKTDLKIMDKQAQINAALYENDVKAITMICRIENTGEDRPLGLIQLYGVQGIDPDLSRAKEIASADFAGLISVLSGSFRTMEYGLLEAYEAEWVREKMTNMKYLEMLRGIPMAKKAGADMSKKGKENVDPNSEETSEEFAIGMAGHDFIFMTLASCVQPKVLENWLTATSKQKTTWASIMQGSTSIGAGISLPVMFAGNLGSSLGSSSGASSSMSQSESISNGISENYGTSHTDSAGISEAYGTSHSTGISHTESTGTSESFGESHSMSSSVSVSDSVSNSVSLSSSESYGESYGISNGYSQSQSHSYSSSESSGFSQNMSEGVSSNHGVGAGDSSSSSQSASSSASMSGGFTNSAGDTATDAVNKGNFNSNLGATTGVNAGLNVSVNSSGGTGLSTNAGGSTTASGGSNYGHGSSWGNSAGVGTGYSTSESWGEGFSSSFGEGYSYSASSSESAGESEGITKGWSEGMSIGQSRGMSIGQSVSHSVGQGWSEGVGTSHSQGVSSSISNGTSESWGTSQTTSHSKSVSDGTSHSTGTSSSMSTGRGQSSGKSSSSSSAISTGTSASMGVGASLSISKSYQFIDAEVATIVEMLEFNELRLKQALYGKSGMFFTDVYIATETEEALQAAKAVAKSAWYNGEAQTCPLQVIQLDEETQNHLLVNFNAFATCPQKERDNMGVFENYTFSTLLTSQELAAYTHLLRVSDGGIYADIQNIPELAVPAGLSGPIYMGKVVSGYKWTMDRGYDTVFDYRIDNDSIMHTLFAAGSRSGKTVAALRYVAEIANNIKRKPYNKRMRVLVMDPKTDWRALARYVEPERFRIYNMGDANSFSSFKYNPLKVPYGVDPEFHLDIVTDVFVRSYGLGVRSVMILMDAFKSLYEKEGVFATEDKQEITDRSSKCTLKKAYEWLEQEKESGKIGRDKVEAVDKALDRLKRYSWDTGVLCKLYSQEDGMSIDEILGADDVIVLESGKIQGNNMSFIFGMITASVYTYAKYCDNNFVGEDQFETLLVVEEANRILTGEQAGESAGGVQGESIFEEMLDQAAGLGIFVVSICQKPTALPLSVIVNSGLLFSGKMSYADDIELMLTAQGKELKFVSREIKTFMPKCPIGQFIVQSKRTFDYKQAEAVLIHVDGLSYTKPTDAELRDLMLQKQCNDILNLDINSFAFSM